MQDKCFIDSNLWIYLYLETSKDEDKLKQQKMEDVLCNYENICISNQILNEIANVLYRKYSIVPKDIAEYLREIVQDSELVILTDLETFEALTLIEDYKISFYDALVIAAALKSNCNVLYSEDMQHKQVIRNKLMILNPFL
jgi:predicted nucleic acid-binding protein